MLTLQTRQAQRLVKGRSYSADRPAIIGLIGFANLVRSVWHGARADDPYADWWMLKIHEALEQVKRELSGLGGLAPPVICPFIYITGSGCTSLGRGIR